MPIPELHIASTLSCLRKDDSARNYLSIHHVLGLVYHTSCIIHHVSCILHHALCIKKCFHLPPPLKKNNANKLNS